jgi:hypothetical protein
MTAKQLLDHPWLKAPKSMDPLTHGVQRQTLTVAHPCLQVGFYALTEPEGHGKRRKSQWSYEVEQSCAVA